ncbi:hypothetical protein ACHAWF_017787 [Thalassiosira exigua]
MVDVKKSPEVTDQICARRNERFGSYRQVARLPEPRAARMLVARRFWRAPTTDSLELLVLPCDDGELWLVQ